MSDLISRAALLEAVKTHGRFNHTEQVINLITNAPAITQGEPVAYNHHFIYDDDFMPEEVLSHSKEVPVVSGMKYASKTEPLFTTPPQPQSVKDALEEAAKICDECGTTEMAAKLIRKLIEKE